MSLGEGMRLAVGTFTRSPSGRVTITPDQAKLAEAGFTVYPINPLQAARYRERHGTSGAKSDARDAHALADMVRTDAHQLRAVAGEAIRCRPSRNSVAATR